MLYVVGTTGTNFWVQTEMYEMECMLIELYQDRWQRTSRVMKALVDVLLVV